MDTLKLTKEELRNLIRLKRGKNLTQEEGFPLYQKGLATRKFLNFQCGTPTEVQYYISEEGVQYFRDKFKEISVSLGKVAVAVATIVGGLVAVIEFLCKPK